MATGEGTWSAPAATRLDLASARRRLWTDRSAAQIIRAGGLAVVASILAIFVFLLIEIWPLLRPARLEPLPARSVAGTPAALLVDEHRTHAVGLSEDGSLRVWRIADGVTRTETEAGTTFTAVTNDAFGEALAGATPEGRVLVFPVTFGVRFEGAQRVVEPELSPPLSFPLDPTGQPLRVFTARYDAERDAHAFATAPAAERTAVAAQTADGRVIVARHARERNPFGGATTEKAERTELGTAPPLAALALDVTQRHLYAGARDGRLFWWDLEQPDTEHAMSSGGRPAVTSLELLIGGRSLVVGRADGSIAVWFLTPRPDAPPELTRIREFPSHEAAIRLIGVSQRDRSFLVQDESDTLGLYYSTSHRTLWRGASPAPGAAALAFAPEGDGAVFATPGALRPVEIDNPHPEVSLEAFFGKVWYEGFAKPLWIWQSSSGDDEFEPKLSLTPLISGTLKGTFYALILAVPLGVLGAMYTSQFMHPRLQRVVKPSVEIMAALPSVVLGFLAGLWLAPRLERFFPALLLALVAVPLASIAAGWSWERLPRAWRGRFPEGAEIGWMCVFLAGALALCFVLDNPTEVWLFQGSFPAWVERTTGLRYDQRNAVVVGIAMGFAVIPIIFAIAEDAFSNVPRDLAAGSRALGANRWQTVVRVVLPTASPGIFSAIMIGFGRAVGETMIVLMATGNTPVMSWSPFDGFRTLSANIAVEIPEAPQGGTLYRTLFVAALLLFVFTFVVNTVAELVRHRLRRRYARL